MFSAFARLTTWWTPSIAAIRSPRRWTRRRFSAVKMSSSTSATRIVSSLPKSRRTWS
jgi:hypothetical protein